MTLRRVLAHAALLAALLGGSARLAFAAEGEDEGEGHAGEHHAGFDGRTFAYQLVNLSILAGILSLFALPAINKALAGRHDQLKADLAAAAAAKTQAEERLRQHETRVANLEKEIAEMKAGFAAESEAERRRLVATAEERAQRMQDETTFLVEQQIKEARLALRREVAEAALAVAEDVLRRTIGAADQARLSQAFVTDVTSGGDRDN